MAKGINEYLERYGSDADFRAQVEADFDAATRDYDLSQQDRDELREYLRSDRHRNIQGHATRVLEDALAKRSGAPSDEEMRLIEERETRNRQALFGQPVRPNYAQSYQIYQRAADLGDLEAAQDAIEDLVEQVVEAWNSGLVDSGTRCLICDELKPPYAWFKGWRRDLCPEHRNASVAETLPRHLFRAEVVKLAAERRRGGRQI